MESKIPVEFGFSLVDEFTLFSILRSQSRIVGFRLSFAQSQQKFFCDFFFSLSFLNEGCNYWERSNEVQPRKLSSFGCDCWRRERYHLPSQISNIIKKKPKEYKSEIRAITLLWGREERAENHVKHPSNYHHANAIKNPKPWKSIILRCVLECIKLFARGSLYRINPLFSKNEMKILSLDFLLHLCS